MWKKQEAIAHYLGETDNPKVLTNVKLMMICARQSQTVSFKPLRGILSQPEFIPCYDLCKLLVSFL